MAGFQILTVNYLRLRLVVGEVYKKWLIWKVYAKISRYKNSDVASGFAYSLVSKLLVGKYFSWENSRLLPTPQLFCPRNDVWLMNAEISHWRRATAQIWVVLLSGWLARPDQSEALPRSGYQRVTSMEFSDVISWGKSVVGRREISAVFSR